jgi:alpha-tubulin suppressor-like RCC1 family protein
VYVWGSDQYGVVSKQPDLSGGPGGIAVAAGADHAVVLLSNGSVIAWGAEVGNQFCLL